LVFRIIKQGVILKYPTPILATVRANECFSTRQDGVRLWVSY